ncbi:MAG: DUF2207 domain-containing protein [Gammaproteobacteria bacterium]|nr:DUF2207 domain-containing protein [Gammaproteobacteria bacterium]
MKRGVLAIALVWFSSLACADERILDYRSDILVHEDGWLTVTETLRVRSEGREIRRGIYRDFPTRYRDRLGNHVNVEFQPLSVLRNGADEDWHTEDRTNGVRLYAGSSERMLQPGIHEYVLSYRSNRQLGFFDGHDELYFNAIGTGWVFPIDHAVVTVTLPFDLPPGQVEVGSYTGGYGAQGAYSKGAIIAERQVRFETTRPLAPREGLTIVVSWPKGLIDAPSAQQKIRWFLGDNGAALVLLAGLLIVFFWYYLAWSRVGRDPKKGVIIPRYRPPKGLSPAACRYVLSMSMKREAFAAAIVSLAVKGMVEIEEEKKKKFTLRRRPGEATTPLSPGEQAALDALLPTANSHVEMENENHEVFQAAREALKAALKQEYRGRLFNLNGLYLLGPILTSVAAAVLAAFFQGGPAVWLTYLLLSVALHITFAVLMRAPTPAGRMVMDEIEGFRMYLGIAEADRLHHMRSPQLTPEVFEAFLPYAYALGVENDWCNRFTREMPREIRDGEGYHPAWYHGRMQGIGALHHLGSNFSNSFSSAIASASTPPGSSSGSGGFSGGGGGGGGGGGW